MQRFRLLALTGPAEQRDEFLVRSLAPLLQTRGANAPWSAWGFITGAPSGLQAIIRPGELLLHLILADDGRSDMNMEDEFARRWERFADPPYRLLLKHVEVDRYLNAVEESWVEMAKPLDAQLLFRYAILDSELVLTALQAYGQSQRSLLCLATAGLVMQTLLATPDAVKDGIAQWLEAFGSLNIERGVLKDSFYRQLPDLAAELLDGGSSEGATKWASVLSRPECSFPALAEPFRVHQRKLSAFSREVNAAHLEDAGISYVLFVFHRLVHPHLLRMNLGNVDELFLLNLVLQILESRRDDVDS